jgi:hypothetical protein
MPQMLADPRFQHEQYVEIDVTPRPWRRAPFAAPVLPAATASILPFVLTLFLYSPRYLVAAPQSHIYPFVQ